MDGTENVCKGVELVEVTDWTAREDQFGLYDFEVLRAHWEYIEYARPSWFSLWSPRGRLVGAGAIREPLGTVVKGSLTMAQ